MTETFAEYLTKIYLLLFFSIPLIVVLAGSFCMWKAFGVYKILGDRVKNVGFLWFYFLLQSPYTARQMPGYVDHFDSLPEHLKARVRFARHQIRYGTASIFLWIVFVLSFGALAAYLKKHHS